MAQSWAKMKDAAIVSLVVALGLGIAVTRKLVQDSDLRNQAIKRVRTEQAFNRALAVPVRDEENAALADVKRYESKIGQDRLIGLLPIAFLAASLVMFSKSKSSYRARVVRPVCANPADEKH